MGPLAPCATGTRTPSRSRRTKAFLVAVGVWTLPNVVVRPTISSSGQAKAAMMARESSVFFLCGVEVEREGKGEEEAEQASERGAGERASRERERKLSSLRSLPFRSSTATLRRASSGSRLEEGKNESNKKEGENGKQAEKQSHRWHSSSTSIGRFFFFCLPASRVSQKRSLSLFLSLAHGEPLLRRPTHRSQGPCR